MECRGKRPNGQVGLVGVLKIIESGVELDNEPLVVSRTFRQRGVGRRSNRKRALYRVFNPSLSYVSPRCGVEQYGSSRVS